MKTMLGISMIKMDVRKMGCDDMDWINLTPGSDQ
jgi:hypothetical protein